MGESSTLVLYFAYLRIICNSNFSVCFLSGTRLFMFFACVCIRLLASCLFSLNYQSEESQLFIECSFLSPSFILLF